MKNALKKIGRFFGGILAVVLALLVGIVMFVFLPLDYIKYRCSLFYKIERKKYRLFEGSDNYFELYNKIAKHKLPIKYYHNPNGNYVHWGWFVYDGTLLIPHGNLMIEYYSDVEQWFCGEYDGEHDVPSLSITEFLQQKIDEINKDLGYDICEEAIILADEFSFKNLELAKQESRFLIYNHNIVEVLKRFCESNRQQ